MVSQPKDNRLMPVTARDDSGSRPVFRSVRWTMTVAAWAAGMPAHADRFEPLCAELETRQPPRTAAWEKAPSPTQRMNAGHSVPLPTEQCGMILSIQSGNQHLSLIKCRIEAFRLHAGILAWMGSRKSCQAATSRRRVSIAVDAAVQARAGQDMEFVLALANIIAPALARDTPGNHRMRGEAPTSRAG